MQIIISYALDFMVVVPPRQLTHGESALSPLSETAAGIIL
jgi:hypothetical protein